MRSNIVRTNIVPNFCCVAIGVLFRPAIVSISYRVVIRFSVLYEKRHKAGIFNEFGDNGVKKRGVGELGQFCGMVNDVLYCGKGIAGFGKNLHRIGSVGRKGAILAGEQTKCGEE